MTARGEIVTIGARDASVMPRARSNDDDDHGDDGSSATRAVGADGSEVRMCDARARATPARERGRDGRAEAMGKWREFEFYME